MVELFEFGPCDDNYTLGYIIGKKFSTLIKSRLANDLILRNQLLPFAQSPISHSLLQSLSEFNKNKYPKYWDELRGIAEGSDSPFLQIILLNLRKEILPFVQTEGMKPEEENDTICDCSDILVVNDSMAFVAHNEDANVALIGHTFVVKVKLSNGESFTAYTYAGELPSCAFGFNTHGLAFTLNSVPPSKSEIAAGSVGRNFVSRDLLEAHSIDDALERIRSAEISVGHSYNLIDVGTRRILNVETASRNRCSVYEVGGEPFFHANMYLHLKVEQEHDENSFSRQRRAAMLPKESKSDFLSLVGDRDGTKYPIFMEGPLLYTLCTVEIDVDGKTFSIIEGDPKKRTPSIVFSMK